MGGFFDKLKERIFGKTQRADRIEGHKPPAERPDAQEPTTERVDSGPSVPPPRQRQEPYFIQIGLDFGTAYCKCICRDMFLDKAWVHLSPDNDNVELPFLISSSVFFDGTTLQRSNSTEGAYEKGGLYHLKMALQKVGLEDWSDPVLQPFQRAIRSNSGKDVARLAEACAIYLLAGVLGNVRREISARFPGKVEGDYVAVNLAVPVADANHPGVNRLFDRVLRRAWILADELTGHPATPYTELVSLVVAKKAVAEDWEAKEACSIYPEVSANVQGFIRSRTSSPGLYLFSDTGAGTVDQSVFLFGKPDGQEHLTYLHAGVFPLGSSQLEVIAATEDGDTSWGNLELWRQKKEAGEQSSQLMSAKYSVHERLENGTAQTVALSKKKLYSPRQINDLRVIFGGGGHCEMPYRSAVIKQFDGNLFHPKEIHSRRNNGESFDMGMPIPIDLPLEESQRRWMDRLTVAYGLSFEKGQLATFKLPKDVNTPPPEDIWKPRRPTPDPPTKDDV